MSNFFVKSNAFLLSLTSNAKFFCQVCNVSVRQCRHLPKHFSTTGKR